MTILRTVEELEAIYGQPGETSLVKEIPEIIPQYRKFIESSPFCTFASVGPEGLDCSPRGDVPGFVRVHDERTLMMPDRRGNNRADTLKNILRDARVALCFLIPGSITALRVNGEAHISVDADLRQSFSEQGKDPRSVIVIRTTAVYFQCGRAVVRSHLWDPSRHVDPKSLPTPGDVLAELSNGSIGGKDYDDKWEGRAKESLW